MKNCKTCSRWQGNENSVKSFCVGAGPIKSTKKDHSCEHYLSHEAEEELKEGPFYVKADESVVKSLMGDSVA